MATSGTVTIQASSAIKDVAGNALTGTLSRSSTGTKRVIGVNCGNNFGNQGNELFYTPPFVGDNGFQGNEPAMYLTSSPDPGAYYSYYTTAPINMSGVSSPAPEAVYQTIRPQWTGPSPISYSIPVDSGTYKVRLHFAEIYFNSGFEGYQVFDIKVNGVLEYHNFDILSRVPDHTAYIYEVPNISPLVGVIKIDLVPQMGVDGYYRAVINGIEIVKP